MARQLKNLQTKTKKFSRHFFRKHEPQSEDFWFLFPRCPRQTSTRQSHVKGRLRIVAYTS
ncbi:DUF1661 domain-containing protein [Porphyromonas gulae]|uniref:DUF1661 domain-containing protein n=1 Tax=Porphyromonas gulae TaxID=111105 RepID=UPI00126A076B